MRSTGKLSSHVRHNLVGYVAVFMALSGAAYAAKPMITGADIENGSITDTDINVANKNGTAATRRFAPWEPGHSRRSRATMHVSLTLVPRPERRAAI